MAAVLAPPPAEEVDQVLAVLQSADNAARRQAEAQLDAWSQSPGFLTVLMTRTHLAPSPPSRQLAATLLSWRIPKFWPGLARPDQDAVQAALLECFSRCAEPPVLRALGEACNALCQSVGMHRDMLWDELLRLVAGLLGGESKAHRRASLELLAALVESMGMRLHPHYPEIARSLATHARDPDADVRVAALSAIGTASANWCLGAAAISDMRHWQDAAEATVEAATKALAGPNGCGAGPQVLAAALRALCNLAPALGSEALSGACIQLALQVLGSTGAARCAEHCRTQALQLVRSLARKRDRSLLAEPALVAVVPAVVMACKDDAPSVDDIDEVSAPAQAARECLRALARADAARAVPLALEAARGAARSVDAMDRAAAVHAVAFVLSGAREVPAGWAVDLAGALGDVTVWVRQAACEGVAMLADSLRPVPAATEGLVQLLGALAELLPKEPQLEIVCKAAEAMSTIFPELTTDEAAPVLCSVVRALLASLPPAGGQPAARGAAAAAWVATLAADCEGDAAAVRAGASAAVVALARAIGAAAGAGADHFTPFAVGSAAALLPLMREGHAPAALAASLDAAGAVVASAWAEPQMRAAREELAEAARRALADRGAPSEVRASAHCFFSSVAMASFEEFAPQLAQVVPPAVEALGAEDGSSAASTARRQREVRTGAHEERVAAVEALGSYAAAVGAPFAAHLPAALPALCAQAQHPTSQVRAAAAAALARVGRMLGAVAGGLSSSDADRAAAAAMAQATARAVCSVLEDRGGSNSATALRSGLQARDDLAECPGFVALAGPEAAAAMAAAGAGQRAEDVESSDDEEALEDAEDGR